MCKRVKRIFFMIMITMCLFIVVGCGKEKEMEAVEVISFAELDAQNVASWRENTTAENVSVPVRENCCVLVSGEPFLFGDGKFVQIAETTITTDTDEWEFGTNYGKYYENAFIIQPTENQTYVILQVEFPYVGRSNASCNLLLVDVSGDKIVLCQEMWNAALDIAYNPSCIMIYREYLGLGGKSKYLNTWGSYRLDVETQTLVLADEWLELQDEDWLIVDKNALPVTINDKEVYLPVGTKIRFLETDLNGTYHIMVEDTEEVAVLTYEIDEYGQYMVGGRSAACYFTNGIVLEKSATRFEEAQIAYAEADAGGIGEVPETTQLIQGEQYLYSIQCFCEIRKEDGEYTQDRAYWIIQVYDGDVLVQELRQDRILTCVPGAKERIWEADVNFDGRKDLLVCAGMNIEREHLQYNCYIANDDGTFTEAPSFVNMKSPRIDKERQMVYDSYAAYEGNLRVELGHEYNGEDFVITERCQYSWDQKADDWAIEPDTVITRDDCISYETLLSAEGLSEADKKELGRFEAVFETDTKMHMWWEGMEEDGLYALHRLVDDAPGLLYLKQFALLDMTGDGKKELVMEVSDRGHCVLVICEENGVYYLSYHSIRNMQIIYEDGMFCGSGGAGYYRYDHLYFDNGMFERVAIAEHELETDYLDDGEMVVTFEGTVNGEAVTEEEFRQWEEQNATEQAEFYTISES